MKTKKGHDILPERFVVGPMGVNCYILADPVTKEACIIDPGADPERILSSLSKRELKPKFIINTHGHGDHIAANGSFGLPVYIHRLDREFLADPAKNLSKFFIFSVRSPDASRLLEDGENIPLGALELTVIHTPGHTPGSISIGVADIIFTGDTLFRGGVGRTDFEYGDEAQLLNSIREKLLNFGDDTTIYPGHGDPSTIGEERSSNPFLADD